MTITETIPAPADTHELITAHLPLAQECVAEAVARCGRHADEWEDDLTGEAHLALCESVQLAAEAENPGGYLRHAIRARLRRYIVKRRGLASIQTWSRRHGKRARETGAEPDHVRLPVFAPLEQPTVDNYTHNGTTGQVDARDTLRQACQDMADLRMVAMAIRGHDLHAIAVRLDQPYENIKKRYQRFCARIRETAE